MDVSKFRDGRVHFRNSGRRVNVVVSERVHLVVSVMFYKGDKLFYYLFTSMDTKFLLKTVYPLRKEFAPTGRKFFPFRVDPF